VGRCWGIMGTGGIAAALADAIVAEGDEVVAVSSASSDRAATFAAERGIPEAYGSHHALVDDPAVDVVYVATTNERHHLDVRACIDAGLPVLAEKPFALDVAKTSALIAAARAADVFVMEAMWMRMQPAFLELERRVAAGDVGTPKLVTADFGINAHPDPSRRWFSREQGGGALLDVGIYPLTLAVSVLGAPSEVRGLGELATTGVDAQLAVAMRHPVGLSAWSASFVADSGVEATVAGSEGSLRVHGAFHSASRLSLRRHTEVVEDIAVAGHELGYRLEVREVQRCLDAGAKESPRMPLELTLQVARVMEDLRGQLGVVYPG
jgi:predicted dehydrogenase